MSDKLVKDAEPKSPTEEGLVRNKYADKMNATKKQIPKPVRWGLTALVAVLFIGGGVWLVHRSGQTEEQGVQTTALATKGFLETYVEGNGTTSAKKKVELGKDLKGKVTEVLATAGQSVKAGDVLFIVDPDKTRDELDDAVNELDTQRETVRKAQEAVSNLNVKAPFTGKLLPKGDTELTLYKGDTVAAGTELGILVDDETLRLPLYFSNTYADKLKKGQAATVSVPGAMSTVSGEVAEVDQIEKISDDGAKLFRAVITLKNPGALKKDMVATASVKTNAGTIMPAEAGKLAYNREKIIVAETEGDITYVSGMHYYRFKAGEPILTLSSQAAVAALDSAQKLLVSKQERVDTLQKLIDNATVTSPIDGIVVSLDVAAEDVLEGNKTPCVVADMSSIVVKASISMTDIDQVKPGQAAQFTMYSNEGEQTLTGTVQSVSMQADQGQNGGVMTFPAIIAIDAVEGMQLSPDRSVDYKITTAQAADCITVPSSAVVNTETGSAVFVKPAEGQNFENTITIPEGSDVPEGFVLVPVETGIADADNTEIISGINEGDEVYLAGPKDLNDEMNEMGMAG